MGEEEQAGVRMGEVKVGGSENGGGGGSEVVVVVRVVMEGMGRQGFYFFNFLFILR